MTGSRDGDFKIWSLEQLERTGEAKASHKINIGDKIWSIGISPKNTKLVIGSAGYEKMTPCHIYDLERYFKLGLWGSDVVLYSVIVQKFILLQFKVFFRHKLINSLGENFKKGSGILDMHWEDENTLLTCGYDTFLRKWDFRTGQCIQKWMDPHDSAYYCLASDDMYSVMCGSNVFGRVVLWDQRKISYVQVGQLNFLPLHITVFLFIFFRCITRTFLGNNTRAHLFTLCRLIAASYSLH